MIQIGNTSDSKIQRAILMVIGCALSTLFLDPASASGQYPDDLGTQIYQTMEASHNHSILIGDFCENYVKMDA